MTAIESISRHVADLDRARAFYEALGFSTAGPEAPQWRSDPEQLRLQDAAGYEWRELTMTMPTAVSDRDFPLRLVEFRGGARRDWSALPVWSVGTGHLGIGVEDPDRTWDALAAAGQLHAQTRGGRPLPMPNEMRAEGEHHLARPFAAFRDPDGHLIEIQPARRAHPATPNWVELADERPGFSHVNLNVADMQVSRRFFELLGIEFAVGPYESYEHPWLSQLFGTPVDEDRGWTIVYGRIPEVETGTQFPLEFIEFASLPGDPSYRDARLTDSNTTVVSLRVTDVDGLLAELVEAGATTVSDGGVRTLPDGARAVVVRAPDALTFLELREVAA